MVAVCEKVITQVGNVSDYMLHPPGINLLQVFLPVNPIISVRALTPNEEAAHLYSLPVLTPKLQIRPEDPCVSHFNMLFVPLFNVKGGQMDSVEVTQCLK